MKNNNYRQFNIVTVLTIASILIFLGKWAYADDLQPPLYRGNPLSVYAHWLLQPGTNFLNLNQWSSVDDSDTVTYLYPNFIPSTPVQPSNSNIYQLQLPNFVDEQPIKYMRLQLTWQNTPQLPINIFSEGLDGINLISGTITATSPLYTMLTGYYQYYDFEFKPNPDFERVHIQLPPDGLLSQVVIDTVSTIPEPATMALLGLGSLALRRKRKA